MLSWLSVLAVALSNFSIQYNFGSIAIALLMMSAEVCTQADENLCLQGKQEAWVQSVGSSVVFIGAVLGQLAMGRLGDMIGRSPALLATMALSTFSSALQAIAPRGSPRVVYTAIIVCRFFLGVGVGGIYPLSATKAVEDAASSDSGGDSENFKANKKAVAAGKGFFWQMPGMMGPYILSYLLTFSSLSVDSQWRLELGMGALPSGLAWLCLVMEMREKDRLDAVVTGSGEAGDSVGGGGVGGGDAQSSHACLQTAGDIIPAPPDATRSATSASTALDDDYSSTSSIPSQDRRVAQSAAASAAAAAASAASAAATAAHRGLSVSELVGLIYHDASIRRRLYGTALCWFLFDVIVYGIGLIAPEILASITHDTENITTPKSIRSLSGLTLGTMALSIPGTLLTIWVIPYKGVKWIQVWGFAAMSLSCLLMGVLFSPLRDDVDGLFSVYCILSVAVSLGVGISTYTLPALLFEKDIRASFNGLCAATGKVGAVIGSMAFSVIARSSPQGYTAVMIICFFVSALAALLSHRFVYIPSHPPPQLRGDGDGKGVGVGAGGLEWGNEFSSSSSPSGPDNHSETSHDRLSEVEVTSVLHHSHSLATATAVGVSEKRRLDSTI